MTSSKLPGAALIAAGITLLAVLSYEPSNVATALGLQNLMDEGSVVLATLALVTVSVAGGWAALRAAAR